MNTRILRAALLAAASTIVLPASAQDSTPDLVITANKQAQSIQQIGSAVRVISNEEIEKAGDKSIRDVLQGQPGISVVESGGPGGAISIFTRGTESNHTLVLVDGVRMSDPTQTGGQFDLRTIPPQVIERIEIVRGPQSALYGSDAIGGVVNIITKKSRSFAPVWQFRAEGGSYGTYSSKLSVAGATSDTTYALGVNQFHADGFKRYGYRIPRLSYLNPEGSDPVSRYSAFAKISRKVSDVLTLEFGMVASRAELQYDAGAYTLNPFEPQHEKDWTGNAYQKAVAESGAFRTTFTTFETRITRNYGGFKTTEDWYTGLPVTAYKKYQYAGTRIGAELQEDINLDRYGRFTIGTRVERERSEAVELGVASDHRQDTRAAYFLYQVSPFDRLHVSLGGRSDNVSTFGMFNTYRATAAYDVTSNTKLRASYGTGAKAPSLYQLYSPAYGNTNLQAESSRGFDVGVDQIFSDGDARASVTYFQNRITNLIDTVNVDPINWIYKYTNVHRAHISGVEVSGEYNVVPTFAKLKTAYTFLEARDRETGFALPRRPKHSARVSVQFTPTRELAIEPVLFLVSKRSDTRYDDPPIYMSSYARFDLLVDYKVNNQVSVFARGENLTNAKYEEARDYGVAGRSVYAGVKVTW